MDDSAAAASSSSATAPEEPPELGVPCEEEPDIVIEKYQHEQPDYFPEEFVDNWFSFSHLGIYYCYKISLEGCFKITTTPTDIVLAVKCDMGSDFISNSFKLWGVQDYISVTMKYVGIIHLNQEQVIIARRFQRTILSLLINKDCSEVSDAKYFHEMQVSMGVVYLLLPLVSGKVDWCSIKFSASPVYEATNKDMRHCHSCKDVDLLQTKDGPLCWCMLQNSIVCTPHNSRFYAVTGFLDLNAKRSGSILSSLTRLTLNSKYMKRHGLNLTHESQPLLAASELVKVCNFLHKCHYKKEKEPSNTYAVELPPELCRVVMSPVSANTLYSFSYIPSIMYRIQCMLLSVKLKVQLDPRMQQFVIPTQKILEAVTTKECQEKFSQESLETLGDSFLKYVTTEHLYYKYKLHREGILTKMKEKLISNAALCQLACNNNLVRLEFLGDAVLDHLFTVYYYNQYPECTPGLLTDLRSASVNNSCYAHAAVKAGLNKHILHSSSELHTNMSDYLENIGQSFTGPSHGWEAGIGLPKVLADVIESIAGAIYLDSKRDKDVVWRSMKRLLEPLATAETIEPDPVKELQELCDRKSYMKSYTKTHRDGVSSVVAEVQAEGTSYSATRTGPNKIVAKKLAAKAVLKDLKAALP